MPIITIAKLIGEVVKLTVEATSEAIKLSDELEQHEKNSNSNSNSNVSRRYVKTEHYEGTYIGKTPHGFGTQKFSSGSSFTGEFVNGLKEGTGTFCWANGYKYQGSWKKGKRSGFGILFNPENITIYVGEWENDARNGQGTQFSKTGISYIGQWKEDQRQGTGKSFWPDGFVCLDGEWERGNFVKGKFHYNPTQHPKHYGSIFEGTFKDWKFDQGVLTKRDGTRYEGGFVERKYEGQGTLYYPENDPNEKIMYTGGFSKGLKHGYGKESDRKGNEYEGQFENNARHGKGVLKFGKSGNVYEGPFVKGHMCGKGVLKLASGGYYEGTWENSLLEGEVVWTAPDGTQHARVYKAGARIDNK